MKHLLISAAAAAVALTGLSNTPAAAAGASKSRLAICHFAGNMRDDTENRTGRVLVLPVRPAIAAHAANHGDVPLPQSLRPAQPFRSGESCTVKTPPNGFLTGEVSVGGVVVLEPQTSQQIQLLLTQLVNDSDLTPAEKLFLLGLIAQAFD